jgi:hypothetical protein
MRQRHLYCLLPAVEDSTGMCTEQNTIALQTGASSYNLFIRLEVLSRHMAMAGYMIFTTFAN